MTPYQLDESANAPCTRTMVGLAGCAVATVPVSKKAHECPCSFEAPLLAFGPGIERCGPPRDQGATQRPGVQSLSIFGAEAIGRLFDNGMSLWVIRDK
jgi:hypothetical protein